MPVPYMGSKRQSAPKIINLIKVYKPEQKEFYDVFCGGFAISEWAIKKGYNVYASDKNEAVVNLINEVLFGEALDPKTGISIFEKPRFISRNEWLENKDGTDWWAGYLQTIWSFGNKTGSYLFGKDVEPTKRAGHDLVVDKKIAPEILDLVPKNICEKIITLDNWHLRRMALRKYVSKNKTRILELERLRQLQQLQQLEQLQQLRQLEQLQQLEHKSYDEVNIPPNAIIYCDPPYAGTAEYKENNFDHEKFYDWCREKSKTNPIFISEYNMPDDFTKIYEFSRRQALSKGETKYTEKVFYLDNRKEQ